MRFSWKTSENLLEDKGVAVTFEEVEPEEEDAASKNPSVKDFFVKAPTDKERRANRRLAGVHPYFKERGLKPTAAF